MVSIIWNPIHFGCPVQKVYMQQQYKKLGEEQGKLESWTNDHVNR